MEFAAQRVAPSTYGTLERARGEASAVVIGGGLGGAAAATILAERGVRVTLVEREAYLGGRVGAWTDKLADGEPFEMERGFHAFFRQYYNLRNLLRRIDPDLRHLLLLEDYPLLGPEGAKETFTGLPHRPPFNVMELVRRSPRLRLRDLVHVNVRAALQMMTYHPERTYERHDQGNARDYLDSLNFPPDARDLLFNVFAHSFFNPEERMSAADMLMMFHFYFMGNPEGLVFDVLSEPFSLALWQPLRRHLESRGATVLLEREARALQRDEGSWTVELADGEKLVADVAVLAVEVPALKRLLAASPALAQHSWRRQLEQLDVTSPFAVWRLWLDRQVAKDRYPFVGTTGIGELDNASIYELFEGESKRWALRRGGSVIELHAYAVPEGMDEAALKDDLRGALYEIYPETRQAGVIEERFLWRQDCPAFPPGGHEKRPTVQTPFEGLALAGDYLKLPFPTALMERAVSSGFMAANVLMQRWDLRPEPLWSVPPRGVLARRAS